MWIVGDTVCRKRTIADCMGMVQNEATGGLSFKGKGDVIPVLVLRWFSAQLPRSINDVYYGFAVYIFGG